MQKGRVRRERGKKRLLMGITLSEIGGSQKVVYDIISNLPETEYEITLVTAPGGEMLLWVDTLNRNRSSKIEIITLRALKRDISPVQDLKAFFDLLGILRRGRYDIVHFHNSKIGVLGRIAARMAGVPRIYYTVHEWGINAHSSAAQYMVMATLERIAGNCSTKVICVSANDMEKGIQNRWIPKEKACCIHNGISDDISCGESLRKKLQIPSDIPLLATIMRLSEPKDPIFTIRVAERLRRKGQTFKLLIIGDGPLLKACESLIETLKMQDQVLLLGQQKNARRLLEDVDIFLLFSKWEGLPVAVLEAMFAGKPVVASNVGGVNELVEHGENGFLLDTFDVEKGAAFIEMLLNDCRLRENMGNSGREKACREFSLNTMLKKYQEIYSA